VVIDEWEEGAGEELLESGTGTSKIWGRREEGRELGGK
jgi:hypothetical protein